MKEILFRGKLTDNCEWAYGVPTKDNHGEMVMVESTFECEEYNCRGANCLYVDENTVGQYTGLTDKNGTKIFEGDILHCTARLDSANMVVIYKDAEFRLVPCDRYKLYTTGMGYKYFGSLITEVIGNIYDNPELLEVEE